MKRPCKLVVVPNDQVPELARWLEDADITSFHTPEGHGGPSEGPGDWGVGTHATIWVEEEDLFKARSVSELFLQEVNARATRDTCQQCGYDLRAHSGPGRCPECGQSFDLPQREFIRKCANCGEEVPGDFDVCWNCGESGRSETAHS